MADPCHPSEFDGSDSTAPDRAKAALDEWGIFGQKASRQGHGQGHKKSSCACTSCKWKFSAKRAAWGVGLLLSLAVTVAGVILLVQGKPGTVAFKWLLFLGAFIPVFFACHLFCRAIVRSVELYFFHEYLAHLDTLVKAVQRSMAVIILLVWQLVLFKVLWCSGPYESMCKDNPAYETSVTITFRVMICLFVASLASLTAAVSAKLLSTHFYKSTHFQKLKEALETEFQLRALSKPRKARAKPKVRAGAPESRSGSTVPSPGKQAARGSKPHLQFGVTESSVMVEDGVTVDMPLCQPVTVADPTSGGPSQQPQRDSSWDARPETEYALSESSSSISTYSYSDFGDIQLTLDKELMMELPVELLDKHEQEDFDDMSEEEIERIRTAVCVKTYSSLIQQHKYRTVEGVAEQLHAVRAFGKALFQNLRGAGTNREFITLKDVRLFYTDDKSGHALAWKAFQIFSTDPKAKVTKDEVIKKVEAVYASRSDVAASLSDTEAIIDSLERCISGTLHFFAIGLYFPIWGVSGGFSSFVASLVALSFVFGNTIRNIFESVLFLFVQHPYDIGDWVSVDEKWLLVKNIGMLHTSFLNTYDHTVTLSNAVLFSKDIANLSRFPTHMQYFTVEVDIGCAQEVQEEIMEELLTVMANNPTDFVKGSADVKLTGLTQQGLKASIFILYQYNMPVVDWRRKRRAVQAAVTAITGVLSKHQAAGAVAYSYHSKVEIKGPDPFGGGDGGAARSALFPNLS